MDKQSDPDKLVRRWNLPQLIVRHPGEVMTGTDEWETVEEGTRSLEVLEVLCREQQVKDKNIWRLRLLTRVITMRTKVLEEWMYPERAQRKRGDPDAVTWWGRREFMGTRR